MPWGPSIRIQSGANGTFGAIKFRFQQGVRTRPSSNFLYICYNFRQIFCTNVIQFFLWKIWVITNSPGPRIVPSCHPGWGAVSDLGGSFAERGFKMGHRHSGTTTRAKTAPFQLSFHTLIFRCFVLIPSLCLLSASFFPLC